MFKPRLKVRIGGLRKNSRGMKPRSFSIKKRKRRKKGELSILKKRLWKLCRSLNPETTCYTCGRRNLSGSNRQLGHFIASSLCSPELRFDTRNTRIQCYHCNINLSGNTLQFRLNLIRDHGVGYVEELWRRNQETKGHPIPLSWYQEKIASYTSLLEKE